MSPSPRVIPRLRLAVFLLACSAAGCGPVSIIGGGAFAGSSNNNNGGPVSALQPTATAILPRSGKGTLGTRPVTSERCVLFSFISMEPAADCLKFHLVSGQPDTQYQVSVDGGSFLSVPATADGLRLDDLPEGERNFVVRAMAGGATGNSPTLAFVVDERAPNTIFSRKPNSVSNEIPPVFAFQAEPGSTFRIKLNTGPEMELSVQVGEDYSVPGSLLEGQQNTLKVQATDPAGNVGMFASYSWLFDGTDPGPPDQLDVEPVGIDGFDLTWTAAVDPPGGGRGSGISHYEVFVDTTPGFPSPGARVEAPATTLRLSGRSPCTKHYLAVQAFDAAGNKSSLTTAELRTGCGGDGTFTLSSTHPVGIDPDSAVLGDFNRDGFADIAVLNTPASNAGSTISVLVGKPAGGFEDAIVLSTGIPNERKPVAAYSIQAADLNKDEVLDLVVGELRGTTTTGYQVGLTVFDGDPMGSSGTLFRAARHVASGKLIEPPIGLATLDFNRDGFLDVILGGKSFMAPFGEAVVFFGDGRTFQPYHGGLPSPIPLTPLTAMTTGLSNQGLQIHTTFSCTQWGMIALVYIDRSKLGKFSLIPVAIGLDPTALTGGAWSEDGLLDLAMLETEDDRVSVVLGEQSPNLFGPSKAYGVGDAPSGIVDGDFNGDDILDLAVANRDSGDVSVLLGQGSDGRGTGKFDQPERLDVRDPGNPDKRPVDIKATDLDRNGILDLVVTSKGRTGMSGTVTVLLGNGTLRRPDGTFSNPTSAKIGSLNNGHVLASDLNADGILDLITLNHDPFNDVSVQFGTGQDGRGNAGFNVRTRATLLPRAYPPVAFDITDFNGDGNTDIVVLVRDDSGSGTHPGSLVVLLGNGSCCFSSARQICLVPPGVPCLLAGQVFEIADFNEDGTPDIATVVGRGGQDELRVYTILNNLGSLSFGVESKTINLPDDPRAIAHGDFNGDHITDLFVGGAGYYTVIPGLGSGNRGNGSFGTPVTTRTRRVFGSRNPLLQQSAEIQLPRPQNPLLATDLNGDGLTDLVLIDYSWPPAGPSLSAPRPGVVSMVAHSGGFSEREIAPGLPAQQLVLCTLNGDTLPDFAVLGLAGDVTVFLGAGKEPDLFVRGNNYRTTTSGAQSMVAGDFDEDGAVDLLITHANADLTFFFGQGTLVTR